jgi:WD40 repeat protein
VDRACDYVRQAALGLQYAFEQGMVHRDLKPHNLMLTPGGRVKVLDFGLARFADEASRGDATGSGVVLGTVDYIAPEQADNAHGADIRSDIYSLGCTLYHLLAGRPPFPTGTPLQKLTAHVNKKPQPLTELRDDLPEGLMSVLERMTAKNPRDRYQTPAEVAIALEPFAVPTAVARVPRRRRRAPATDHGRTVVLDQTPARFRGRRLFAIVTAILAFLVAGVLGAAVYRIATDKGELVITTESDDVKVVITQGGKVVDVIDTKTDKQIRLALRSGEYELELKGAPEGLKLNIDKATLTRGKETLAKIEHIDKTPSTPVGQVRRFLGHTRSVWGVALSPDARYALSTSADTTIRLWDLQTGIEIRSYRGHTASTHAVAFLPDGREFLSCSADGTMRHWQTETGKQLHSADLHGHIYDVAVSPDGRLALAAHGDKTLHLWDLKNWREIRRFEGHTERLQRVVFSADGRRALSGALDKTMRLWDVETGTQLKCFMPHQDNVVGVALSPDGRLALSGSGSPDGDGELILWDIAKEKELRRFKGHKGRVPGVAFSPDGRFVLSGADGDCSVRLWEVATGKELHRFDGHEGGVSYSVVFSRDGRYALSGSHDGTMRLWRLPDLPPAEKVGEVRRIEGAEGLCGIAISPNGRYLLSTGSSIQLWDLHDGKYVRSFPGHTARVHAVSFSPDGREFLSCSQDGTMRHWDVETARQLHCADLGGGLYDVVVSPDGRLALAAHGDGTARLWDVKNWKEIRRFEGHTTLVQRLAFSADGRRALSGSWDKTIRLWDVETGKELKCFVGHQGYVMGVALSPDGKQALSGGLDKTLRLWDVETGKELRHFEGHSGNVHGVAFSPDGRFALSGADDNVRLWEVATGKELHRFDGHQGWLYSVVFSHDGRYALSASPHDRTVCLWQLPDLPPAKKKP